MKYFIYILVLICTLSLINKTYAQDEKYKTAMKNNILLIDSAKTIQDLQTLANNFERIGNAEKNKWLPFYYAGYIYILINLYENDNDTKDMYLDKADIFINTADSLEPKNSEILSLKAFVAEMRISIAPMTRWMKFGTIFNNYIDEAIIADTTNPRPEFLKGQMIYYTPTQFGGGFENAKPILEEALRKYTNFKPIDEIHPSWGRAQLEEILLNSEQTKTN